MATTKKLVKKAPAKTSKAAIDKANEAAIVKEMTSNRELKYIYPTDIVGPLERKAFRAKVRAKIKQFEKAITSLKGKDLAEKKKEYTAFKKATLA